MLLDPSKKKRRLCEKEHLYLCSNTNVEIADKITDIQNANEFLQLCLTVSEGIDFSPNQQSGMSYFLQRINNDLNEIKLINQQNINSKLLIE